VGIQVWHAQASGARWCSFDRFQALVVGRCSPDAPFRLGWPVSSGQEPPDFGGEKRIWHKSSGRRRPRGGYRKCGIRKIRERCGALSNDFRRWSSAGAALMRHSGSVGPPPQDAEYRNASTGRGCATARLPSPWMICRLKPGRSYSSLVRQPTGAFRFRLRSYWDPAGPDPLQTFEPSTPQWQVPTSQPSLANDGFREGQCTAEVLPGFNH